MWPSLINKWLHTKMIWAVLCAAPLDWGKVQGIIHLITKITRVLLKCFIFPGLDDIISSSSFSFWDKSNTCRVLPCCAHQLFVDGFYVDYLEILTWKSLRKLKLAVKRTIPGSSVTAVILYGKPRGWETVRSAFPTQCPFQARGQ